MKSVHSSGQCFATHTCFPRSLYIKREPCIQPALLPTLEKGTCQNRTVPCFVQPSLLRHQTLATTHNTCNLHLFKNRRCCDRTSSHLQVSPAACHGSRINLQLPVNSHVPPKVISAPNGGERSRKGSACYFRGGYCKFIVLFYSWKFFPRRWSHRLHVDRFWVSRLDSPPTIIGRDMPTSCSDLSTNNIPCNSLRRPIRRYYRAATAEISRPDQFVSSTSLTQHFLQH